jgi:threonylcarbamoyladenosine tRNA methylthiotransferase MtaB
MNISRKKVAFYTLGCKLNFAETSTISRSFPEDRFEKVPAGTKADIYIINTCSVTGTADKKCRQAVKRFISLSPGAFIAVVGCYAQLRPQEIASIPGVDLVLGINEKFNIPDYLSDIGKKPVAEVHSCDLDSTDSFYPSYSIDDRTRSFLKIQDGCDYGCSYCTIPLARGRSRNQDVPSIIAEAEKIAERGVKEIVLTGVNIGDFGKTTGETLTGLIEKIVDVQGIERIRLSSIEPNLIDDELIGSIATGGKVVPHFHIPLQSGCNKILGLMRRRYKRELFADRVNRIRSTIPSAGIGADVIVGFPGETPDDFDETYAFLDRLPITYLHVFMFSERSGTAAVILSGKVSQREKERRSKSLIGLSAAKNLEFRRSGIGSITDVLFERNRIDQYITGLTPNYLRAEHVWKPELAGRIIKVKLTGIATSGRMSTELIE